MRMKMTMASALMCGAMMIAAPAFAGVLGGGGLVSGGVGGITGGIRTQGTTTPGGVSGGTGGHVVNNDGTGVGAGTSGAATSDGGSGQISTRTPAGDPVLTGTIDGNPNDITDGAGPPASGHDRSPQAAGSGNTDGHAGANASRY